MRGRPGGEQLDRAGGTTPSLAATSPAEFLELGAYSPLSLGLGGGGEPGAGRWNMTNQMPPQSGSASSA